MKDLCFTLAKDIMDAIDKIEEFTENMEYEEFIHDDKTSQRLSKR